MINCTYLQTTTSCHVCIYFRLIIITIVLYFLLFSFLSMPIGEMPISITMPGYKLYNYFILYVFLVLAKLGLQIVIQKSLFLKEFYLDSFTMFFEFKAHRAIFYLSTMIVITVDPKQYCALSLSILAKAIIKIFFGLKKK